MKKGEIPRKSWNFNNFRMLSSKNLIWHYKPNVQVIKISDQKNDFFLKTTFKEDLKKCFQCFYTIPHSFQLKLDIKLKVHPKTCYL